MKLVAACAALMLAVSISIVYKDRIAADPVAVARQCAPTGGQMRAEWDAVHERNAMRVVSLLPLTKRAKQIIKQHGERWEVVRKEMCVLFSDGPGPWLYVQPLTEERAPANDVRAARIESATRWVHEFHDENFKVAP